MSLPAFIIPGAVIQGLHEIVSGSAPELHREDVWIDLLVEGIESDIVFTVNVDHPDFPSDRPTRVQYREGYFRALP
jgi:hypothetical protein